MISSFFPMSFMWAIQREIMNDYKAGGWGVATYGISLTDAINVSFYYGLRDILNYSNNTGARC